MLRKFLRAKAHQRRRVSRSLSSGLCAALCLAFAARHGASQQAAPDPGFDPPAPEAAQRGPQLATAGLVNGTVTGPHAELVGGADVKLSASNGAVVQHAATDNNGQFQFLGVPAGPFTLTVSLQGFDPVIIHGTSYPNQVYTVAPITLQLATVSFVVNAVASQDELALEQVHAEEKQRLLGVLPNFFVSYTWNAAPLTSHEKFALATKNVVDPGNLLLVGALAGEQQAQNAFPGYGQGAQGYGKRYGAGLANLVAGTYMGGAVLPALFRQDPRYFYKGTGSIKSRFWYAITRAVICRGDNGHWQPAFASVLGDLSAGAISNIYYPASDRQGAALTLENGFLGVAGDAMNDVFQEFLLKKLTPKLQKTTSSSTP